MIKPATDPVLAELEKIRKRNAHKLLEAEEVVAFAANPKTALHSHFEWDDVKASHQYRIEQARYVIQTRVKFLQPVRSVAPVRVKAYVSLGSDRAAGGGYRPLDAVLSCADTRKELLNEALLELRRVRLKYQTLIELAPVFEAMDQLEATIDAQPSQVVLT